MARKDGRLGARNEPIKRSTRQFYPILPWECQAQKSRSNITAYVEASGRWEKVLTVYDTSGAAHGTMANFILALIRTHQEKRDVLQDAFDALDEILNHGITFSSEQAAEKAIASIKKMVDQS